MIMHATMHSPTCIHPPTSSYLFTHTHSCGPAHHCIQLAQRGLQVTALDTSGAMLQRAAQRAERANVTLQSLHDDMRTFTMPAPGTIDLAFCLLGTFCHMLTCADALDTMKRVHRYVVPPTLCCLMMRSIGLLPRSSAGRGWLLMLAVISTLCQENHLVCGSATR